VLTESASRSIGSLWAELVLDPWPELTVDVGVRADAWITGNHGEGAIDPRLRATWHVTPDFDLHIAGGVARQPAVPYLSVPGIAEASLERGLQTALQAEVGGRVQIGAFEGELQVFAHHYDDIVLFDAFALAQYGAEVCVRPGGGCVDVYTANRTTGRSWGGELFLRLAPTEVVSGWVSYTLAWAEVDPIVPGLPYRPSYDVRHVLNAVARVRIVEGLDAGVRVFLRSGSAHGAYWVDDTATVHRHEQELDPFFRLDASVAYQWDAGWARLRVSLEWFNVTMSEEPAGLDCPQTGPVGGVCPVVHLPVIFAPNLGIRAEL